MFQWIIFVLAVIILVIQMTVFKEGYKDSSNAYDIIIVAGQSNSLGWSNEAASQDANGNIISYNERVFTTDDLQAISNVFILERDPVFPLNSNRVELFQNKPQIINGTGIYSSIEPMSYHSTSWNVRPSIGFYKTFARRYAAANTTKKVLIVHNGFEATGMMVPFNNHPFIKDNIIRWNVGGLLYRTLVRRVNNVLSWNTNNRVVAVLWSQGEADIDANRSANDYTTQLRNFVNSLRNDIRNQNVPFPFIACGYSADWHSKDSFTNLKNQYMSSLQGLSSTTYDGRYPLSGPIRSGPGSGLIRSGPSIITKFGYVSTVGVTSDVANQNNVHFNFAGLRELGERFWRVYSVIR